MYDHQCSAVQPNHKVFKTWRVYFYWCTRERQAPKFFQQNLQVQQHNVFAYILLFCCLVWPVVCRCLPF